MNRKITTKDFDMLFVSMAEAMGLKTVQDAYYMLRACRPTITLVSLRVSKALKEIEELKLSIEKEKKVVAWFIRGVFDDIVEGDLPAKIAGMKRLEDLRRVMKDDDINTIFRYYTNAKSLVDHYFECLGSDDVKGAKHWDKLINKADKVVLDIINEAADKYYTLKGLEGKERKTVGRIEL